MLLSGTKQPMHNLILMLLAERAPSSEGLRPQSISTYPSAPMFGCMQWLSTTISSQLHRPTCCLDPECHRNLDFPEEDRPLSYGTGSQLISCRGIEIAKPLILFPESNLLFVNQQCSLDIVSLRTKDPQQSHVHSLLLRSRRNTRAR